jgi:hypothetical protein
MITAVLCIIGFAFLIELCVCTAPRRRAKKEANMRAMVLVDLEHRVRLEKAVEDILMQPGAQDTLAELGESTIRIVSEVLRRLDINGMAGTGTVAAHVGPITSGTYVVPDNQYTPTLGERIAFLGSPALLRPPTRTEIRSQIDAEELVPVCPNCGKTIGEETAGA